VSVAQATIAADSSALTRQCANLSKQAGNIFEVPGLNHLPVSNSKDVDVRKAHLLAGSCGTPSVSPFVDAVDPTEDRNQITGLKLLLDQAGHSCQPRGHAGLGASLRVAERIADLAAGVPVTERDAAS
jgi:hypothetical protein